jgi:hypothetical protein
MNSDGGIGPIPTKWRGICQTDSNNWDNFHRNKLTSLSLFNELGVSSCLLILVYNFDLYDLHVGRLIGARYFYNYQLDRG